MASWFTRTLDRITPWDRKGEIERRKKREEEEAKQSWQREASRKFASGSQDTSTSNKSTMSVGVASPTSTIKTPTPSKPKTQRPENLFQDLNQSLMIGTKPKTGIDIIKEESAKAPQPGEVVEPTLKVNQARRQEIRLPDGRLTKDIPDTPEKILNRGLDAGKSWEQIAKENNYDLDKVREYSQATRPNYGITVEKPNQSLGNRFRDIFDANTEADKWRRQEGNRLKGENKDLTLRDPGNIVSRTPVIGHTLKMANTAGVQMPQLGMTIAQKFAVDELGKAQSALAEARSSGDPTRIALAEARVSDANVRVQGIQGRLNKVEKHFKKNKGGWFNAGTLYDEEASKRGDAKTALTDIALPTAVTALDIYTLGKGTAVSESLKQGGTAAFRSQIPDITKLVAGNYFSGDLDARAQGATGWDPIKAGALTATLGSVPDIGLPLIGKAMRNARSVPVKPNIDIPVKVDPSDIVDIPVNRKYRGRPLIKEIKGDFDFPTPEKLQEIRIDNVKKNADAVNSSARPDPRVEGVTPRKTGSFKLDATAAKASQDDLIDQYAGFLRDVGEGNGTQMIPDGEGGYIRTSNNYRPGMGKNRISKEQWREEAERQLRSGKADPAIQKEFDDVVDPDVQSLLSKGEQANDAPVGRPIQVKEARGIPVRDETVVPTNLPETPGRVRVTTAKDPQAMKSKAVAEQPTVIPPKSSQEAIRPKGVETRAASQEPQSKAVSPSTDDGISPARRDLIYSLKEANKQSVRDARALSVARGEKAAKASGMSKGLEGEAATRARRAGFRGELGHRGRYVGIGGEDGERIFNDLRLEAQRNPELSKRIYTLDNVEEALSRAVRGTDLEGNVVGAPTKGQVALLRKYFGEDVGKAVEDAVDISRGLKDKVLEGAGQVVGAPRSIMASLDLSATIRQGGVLSSRFPKEAAKAAKEQLKYFASTKSFKEGMEEITNRASYDKMVKAGLDVTGTQLDKAEEQFISNLAQKIPGLGRGISASDRAYTGFLTKIRADVFDKITDGYAARGIELSQKELDDVAKFINTASGRGSLGALEDHAKTLSTTLFSPRLWKSRLDMLNPAYYAKLSGPARKYALQSAASYASIASTVLGLASLAGANVETDMRSSDFGKIKIGNSRYDILGGFQQNLVFAWRELTGEKKSSTTGEVTKFARGVQDLAKGRSDEEAGVETGPYTPNRVSVATDLISNKANPVLGAAARVLEGKDRGGNPVNPLEELARLSVPLSVSGSWDAANDIGDATNPLDFAKGALINSPDIIGVSSQTYGDVPTKDQNYDAYKEAKERATRLRDEGALTEPKEITAALENRDYDAVLKGYEYQKAMAEGDPDTTAKDLARIDKNIKEAQYLQKGIPKTDDGILASLEDGNWDKAIEAYNWKIERAEADGEISKQSRGEIETDIKRAEVYRDNDIPYEMATEYRSIGVEEWRKMGDPEEDEYNPEMYQRLWAIDELLTKAGASYRKGALDKQKYYLKEKKTGSGSRGGSRSRASELSSDFGTLKAGSFAPQVKEYETIKQQSGSIPIIRTSRPNIVHKISSS